MPLISDLPNGGAVQSNDLILVSRGNQNVVLSGSQFANAAVVSQIQAATGNSGVTPGTYVIPAITVDATGRITSASNGQLAIPTKISDLTDDVGLSLKSANAVLTPGSFVNPIVTVGMNGQINTVANGAILTPGTYTNTNITVNANGQISLLANGTASAGGGGGVSGGLYAIPMTAPKVADFPITSEQYANPITAMDDSDLGLYASVIPSSGDRPTAILKNLPATGDWQVEMRFIMNTIGVNYHSMGFALTDTNSNYLHIIGLDMPGQSGNFYLNWAHNRYTRSSGGGFSGGYLTTNGPNTPKAEFIRIKYTASSQTNAIYTSPNGKIWRKLGAFTDGTLGGKFNRIGIGFGLNYNFGGDPEMTEAMYVPHWKQSF